MAESRDRSSGWKHAKLSGHKNEALVKELLDNDTEYAADFLCRLGQRGAKIVETNIGGLHETNVPSVSGKGKTKSKTDLKVFLDNDQTVNISVKKSLSGQVYFVGAGIFIDTFEKQFSKSIPESVQRAIKLFWAAADDAVDIIKEYGDANSKNYELQLRHKSLNATTLEKYNQELYNDMLSWFIDNAYEIARLCFSMGAVRDSDEWSDHIWYINLLNENNTDALLSIGDICEAVRDAAKDETYLDRSLLFLDYRQIFLLYLIICRV